MASDVRLNYPDTVTFVKVEAGQYSKNKVMVEQVEVPVIFIQNTAYTRSSFRDNTDSDAICFPDPVSDFVTENHNRLEGMYILAPLFGVDDEDAWYKVENVTVNRDHLLNNVIDNVELQLKKSSAPAGVS